MSGRGGGELAFLDLHCHSVASYDSLSRPRDILRVAASRGLTHVAITDHERIDGALSARDAAQASSRDDGAPRVTVIVGEEIRSRDGDVIGLYLERAVPAGLSGLETIAAIHEQGGLAGLPHPFDRFRFSGLARGGVEAVAELAAAADFIEVFNARVPYGAANARAAALSHEQGIPGIAASDAHTLMEVGVAYTRLDGRVDSAATLRDALGSATLVMGRASLAVRAIAPAIKAVQRLRGNLPRRGAADPARGASR